MSFCILVLAALAGMITAFTFGRDPWKMWSSFTLFVPFVIPALGLGLEGDPAVRQVRVDLMIRQITDAVPSVIFGEIVGFVAGLILRYLKELIDLFKGR